MYILSGRLWYVHANAVNIVLIVPCRQYMCWMCSYQQHTTALARLIFASQAYC